ncbi:MAG: hypothetical protein IT190_02055 [Microbacteriaceae bacterium]|nr:hypothetical protein [Microbacteriaceae bacterium]
MSVVSVRAPFWPVQLARAVPALVVGLLITFSVDHSATFGLIVFGIFALTTGIILAWGAFRIEDRVLRVVSVVHAVVAVLSGTAALVFNARGAGTLFLIVMTFAAVTGFLELYQGLRARGTLSVARDWVTVGVLTALLAIAVLLVPADYAAPWTVVDNGVTATGILTSQIVVVGIIGAYAFLIGVYLVIGGLSARWAAREDTESATPVTGE